MTTQDGIAMVAGVGSGLGGAVARRFAAAGQPTALVARNRERLEDLARDIEANGGVAIVCPADVRDEAQVQSVFEKLEGEHGPVEAVIYNAGAQHRQDLLEIEPSMFEKVWRLACYGGFLVGQAAAKRMMARGYGSVIFSGATASLRGGAEFTAFAAAKAGLRSVAQSMARSCGPHGVHVAHVVIDGVIDSPRIHARFPDLKNRLPVDGMLSTDAIADVYYSLHCQHRSAWTFEVDLRPWSEQF